MPLTLTLALENWDHFHLQFFEDNDRMQVMYEKARRACLDRRVRCQETISKTLLAHGLAGLFIHPERVLIPSALPQNGRNPRKNTAFHCAHLPETAFETIARSLAEGVGIAATARIQNVDKKTVLLLLEKAAEYAGKAQRTLLSNVEVSECQLDEMWSFIGKKEKNLESLEKLKGELGDAWIWIALDAVNKVVLAQVIGKRTASHAVRLLQEVKRVTARMPDLFSSDQLDQYETALLQVYGELIQPHRKPGPGRPPKPRLVPSNNLCYVQVVKRYKNYRVVKVDREIVFGDPEKVNQILGSSTVSRKINTSFVERGNNTIRHTDSRCTRKTLRFSKCKRNHHRQLVLSLAYYHLCRPHGSLTKRHGKPTTPFMAARLTDHVWTMQELLRFDPGIPCQ
jgi:IS1 family transposase/histone H3/H4